MSQNKSMIKKSVKKNRAKKNVVVCWLFVCLWLLYCCLYLRIYSILLVKVFASFEYCKETTILFIDCQGVVLFGVFLGRQSEVAK